MGERACHYKALHVSCSGHKSCHTGTTVGHGKVFANLLGGVFFPLYCTLGWDG